MAAAAIGGQLHFKVVLLGEGCVGKTSLVLRYVEDKFNEKHFSTIQVILSVDRIIWFCNILLLSSQASFLTKKINLEGQRVTLAVWDTAGQERFHALGPIYYRDSHAAVLVYDITDQDSFVKVKWFMARWLPMRTDIFRFVIYLGTELGKGTQAHIGGSCYSGYCWQQN